MPPVGGQGGNLGVQLTLFQPGGADYAHHITACPPGFEILAASMSLVQILEAYNDQVLE